MCLSRESRSGVQLDLRLRNFKPALLISTYGQSHLVSIEHCYPLQWKCGPSSIDAGSLQGRSLLARSIENRLAILPETKSLNSETWYFNCNTNDLLVSKELPLHGGLVDALDFTLLVPAVSSSVQVSTTFVDLCTSFFHPPGSLLPYLVDSIPLPLSTLIFPQQDYK
jgi:hypothetical protein